jgi:isoleucyl-tRNA synthetase
MSAYKSSLNLPQTSFPMRGNLAQKEPKTLARWQEDKLYQQIQASRADAPMFILHDGPPYANGDIHLGHSLNKILKDIILKSKTLSGYQAPYVPGWDCHGLPIELKVEKKVGKPGHKVTEAVFREKCRAYAQQQVDLQREGFKRLGVQADWEQPYLTMNFSTEANTIRALAKIISNDHLQKGVKPVHWCTDCGSALAEAEVEYEDKTSPAIDVAFMAVEPEKLARVFAADVDKNPIGLVIWTTTPWTLPANRALAVHAEITYVLVRVQTPNGDQYLVVASELKEACLKRYGEMPYEVLGEALGQALEHVRVQHPFYEFDVPVIVGEHVSTESGTGIVHTAPGHGLDDFIVAQHYGLEVANPVNNHGVYKSDTPLFAGQHVFKTNDDIVALLQQRGALIHSEAYQHSYPHCWRHKTPIIFRATPQWFVSMDKASLRKQALTQIAATQWLPSWGEERIEKMVAGRPDWCISRQRTWGVPIAVFIHKETEALHPNTFELMEQVAQLVESAGIQAWYDLDPRDLLGEEADDYTKVTDILDVWFDAGASFHSVVEQREEFKAQLPDLYLEGSDQHRGWFMSSLMIGTAIHGKAPYKQVLTHGFTVDEHGRKMSKSLGNTFSPKEVVNKLGADILRLWVASTDYSAEMTVSDEVFQRNADAYRRIRNTARFLLANLNGFDVSVDQIDVESMVALDRWILRRAAQVQQEIIEAYTQYQFHVVVQKVMNFCSVELGSFYLDIIKDRQYTAKTDGLARRSCQTAMYHLIEALVRWIAPVLSFTADEIWQSMPHHADRASYVFTQHWYQNLPEKELANDIQDDTWEQIRLVREQVNKMIEKTRQEGVIGSSLQAHVELFVDAGLRTVLDSLQDELRFVLLTSSVNLSDMATAPDTAISTDMVGLKIAVGSTAHTKCERCWHFTADVGTHQEHPTLCSRCVENIEGQGEQRLYA